MRIEILLIGPQEKKAFHDQRGKQQRHQKDLTENRLLKIHREAAVSTRQEFSKRFICFAEPHSNSTSLEEEILDPARTKCQAAICCSY